MYALTSYTLTPPPPPFWNDSVVAGEFSAGVFPEKWNACTGVLEDASLLERCHLRGYYVSMGYSGVTNLKDMSVREVS